MAKEISIEEAAKAAGVKVEDMKKAMELLQKDKVRKDKIARGEIKGSKKRSEMTAEEIQHEREKNTRRNTRTRLILEKAAKQGISVSEAEIDAAIAQK